MNKISEPANEVTLRHLRDHTAVAIPT